MRLRRLCSILVLGWGLIGCSNALQVETGRWSSHGEAPARPHDLDLKAASLNVNDRKMIFQKQKVDGVEIEDSYYKEIESQFVAYRWTQGVPLKTRSKIVLMKAKGSAVQKGFFKAHPEYNAKDLLENPVLVLRRGEPQWKFTFEGGDGSFKAVYVDQNLIIQEQRGLGSHMETPSATLFPDGPLRSQLQKVLLAELMGNKLLVSPRVRVSTQSSLRAEAEDSQFLYPVEDQRFEQVQVFFYLTKMLSWCQSELNFTLPFPLEAETSVGFPEKTNAAFYYQHRIRLGDGDESVFSHLPLDPSIVMHESFHGLVEAVAGLPYEGEGGSLNEGMADLFTALVLDNPRLGEASYRKGPFKRTVDNTLKFSETNGGLYHDSGIISGLLWSLHKSLGAKVGLHFIWEVLLHLNPDSKFADFKTSLVEAQSKLTVDQQLKVQSILKQRGWAE